MPSMPTEALLDVNVVIASVFADHINHLQARTFVESLERFYTTPTVQGGFLRFATRPLKNDLGELQQPRLTMARRFATSNSLLSQNHLNSWSHFRGAPHPLLITWLRRLCENS